MKRCDWNGIYLNRKVSNFLFVLIFFVLSSIGHIYAVSLNSDIACQQQQLKFSIKGQIFDENKDPVIGASVLVKGTSNGSISDLNGNFELHELTDKDILVVSFVGYRTQEIHVGNKRVFSINLLVASEELEEVVVTAMGIKREKKALGYAMQEVKTDALIENKSESVSNMLQGKVAGLHIAQSGTGMGGSTRVVMRGLNSLSGNNQPLWVIDGIPINDTSVGTASQWGGIDYSGGASEINPENIESISVLKGPNAAALYGSRAQNGAIVIVTKKGKQNQPIEVQYNSNINFSTIYEGYKLQNKYGQGSDGEFAINSTTSWGPEMKGQNISHWRNEIYGDNRYGTSYAMLPQKSQMKDFFETGVNLTNTVSVAGGGERIAGRISLSDVRNHGVTPTHALTRHHVDANLNFKESDLFDVGLNMSYTRQKGNNRPIQGQYASMIQFIRMPRNIRTLDIEDPVGIDGQPVNWSGPSNELFNPYAVNAKGNGNQDYQNRMIGQLNGSVKILDCLRLSGKVGIDWMNINIREFRPFNFRSNSSQYDLTERTFQELNADFMFNFNKYFGDFTVLANAGAAMTNIKVSSMTANAGQLVIPELVALSNGDLRSVLERRSEKEIHSVLGNVQVGYSGKVYLDFSARNDWSSTLPKSNWSYFYPSISLSGIMTEIFKLPEDISFMKLRASWAKVGNDTSPYQLHSLFSTSQMLQIALGAAKSSVFPLSTLKPESTNSFEAGLDMKLFNGRVGLDFTYYNSKTTNQILSIQMLASSGYTSKKINAGKMSSQGIELMITTTPIQTKDWTWDLNFNWGVNSSKNKELDPSVKRHTLGSTRLGSVVVEEGGKFGDIVANKVYKRNDEGEILIKNGLPVIERDKIIGNMMPKWTGSISSTLRWRDLTLGALIDIKYGGDLVSMTDSQASGAGNSKRTLDNRDKMIVDGIDIETGQKNQTPITAQKFYQSVGGEEGVAEEFMYDGTYVKFRELSLGYTLPKQWVESLRLKSVKISLVGRDLFFLHKNTPGFNPEGSFSRNDYAQAFEIASLPPTRNFGFNINVKF